MKHLTPPHCQLAWPPPSATFAIGYEHVNGRTVGRSGVNVVHFEPGPKIWLVQVKQRFRRNS